jgi:hypothetical protein
VRRRGSALFWIAQPTHAFGFGWDAEGCPDGD